MGVPGRQGRAGETDEAALRREVRERIGVDVQVKARIASRHHQYDGYSVDLNLYQAVLEPGHEPQRPARGRLPLGGSTEFDKYPFPAADQATTDLLLGIDR